MFPYDLGTWNNNVSNRCCNIHVGMKFWLPDPSLLKPIPPSSDSLKQCGMRTELIIIFIMVLLCLFVQVINWSGRPKGDGIECPIQQGCEKYSFTVNNWSIMCPVK